MMGKGAIVVSFSWKQGMNARSSTEAKVVTGDDEVPFCGLDNSSKPTAPTPEMSYSRTTRMQWTKERWHKILSLGHSSLFFVMDQKEQGLISIEFCPMEHMADCGLHDQPPNW
jgi:hypothetical protein